MQTVNQLRREIETNLSTAANVCRMIEVNQTSDERQKVQTIHDNERGFSKEDAPYLQPIATKLWQGVDPQELSGAEKAILKAYTAKYAQQYLDWSNWAYALNNPVC